MIPTARALYCDTDSFFLLPYGSDVDDRRLQLLDACLDTSGYPESHKLFSGQNKMKLGVFKNEYPTTHMLAFCCLKAKLYSFKTSNNACCVRAKGVNKCESRKLTYDMHKYAVEDKTVHKVRQQLIGCKLNKNKSISVDKIALNPFDNKRYICSDGITTFPFGHKNLDDVCGDDSYRISTFERSDEASTTKHFYKLFIRHVISFLMFFSFSCIPPGGTGDPWPSS